MLVHADDFAYGGEAGFKMWLYRTAMRKIAHRHEHWQAQKRAVGREVDSSDGDGDGDAADLLACYRAFYTPASRPRRARNSSGSSPPSIACPSRSAR